MKESNKFYLTVEIDVDVFYKLKEICEKMEKPIDNTLEQLILEYYGAELTEIDD